MVTLLQGNVELSLPIDHEFFPPTSSTATVTAQPTFAGSAVLQLLLEKVTTPNTSTSEVSSGMSFEATSQTVSISTWLICLESKPQMDFPEVNYLLVIP